MKKFYNFIIREYLLHRSHRSEWKIILGYTIIVMMVCQPALGNTTVKTCMPSGCIDWTQATVSAVAESAVMPDQRGTVEGEALAARTALRTARKRLRRVIGQILIKPNQTLKQMYAGDDLVMARIEAMVSRSELIKKQYLTDGTVRIQISIPLKGGLSQLVLPEDITQIEPIRTISSSDQGKLDTQNSSYSGLIIDMRGTDFRPTLILSVQTPSGNPIYGPAFASRDYAVKRGMISYAAEKTIESPETLSLLGRRPLLISGTPSGPPEKTVVLINEADAAKLKQNAAHLDFLRQCRVLVLTDSGKQNVSP